MADAIAAAFAAYKENIKERPPVLGDEIGFQKVGTENFSVTGDVYLRTPLLGLVGIDSLPLLALGHAEMPKSVYTSGASGGISLEISLMLDLSGSMEAGTKFPDLKAAATDLADIVLWEDQSVFTSRLAIVPFSTTVRPPTYLFNLVKDPALASGTTMTVNGASYYRATCVTERTGAERFTDAAPGPGAYMPPKVNLVAAWGTDTTCHPLPGNEIRPLSSDRAAVKAHIAKLKAAGGTAGHLGTAWAWYMLSPNWARLLPPASKPAPHNPEAIRKIAILMTDGGYNIQHTAFGFSVGPALAPNGSSNEQALALCSNIKAAGIEVFTVGFDFGTDAAALKILETCASSKDQFYAPGDGGLLKQAFRDIGMKIILLYVAN